MGIIFDATKFNQHSQFSVDDFMYFEIKETVAFEGLGALSEPESDGAFKAKLNDNSFAIKIKPPKSKYSFANDAKLKKLVIKGSFKDVDPNDQETWKSARIDEFRYKGKDGIINVKESGKKGSLGSLYDWANIDKLGEFVLRGDDIIYGSKKSKTQFSVDGYSGDDTFFLYGGESVAGGKGKDRFVFTKDAVKNSKRDRRSSFFDRTVIIDASSAQGDVVEIVGRESDFDLPPDKARDSFGYKYVGYDKGLEIFYTKQPVFADFLAG